MRESDWVTRTEIESECLNGRQNRARKREGRGEQAMEVSATEKDSESVEERRVEQVNQSEQPALHLSATQNLRKVSNTGLSFIFPSG